MPFSALSLHMWETCISGKPREKTVTGEINYCIKKNLGKCRHEKQSLLPTESPGERKYASSCYYYLAGRNPQLCWTSLRVAVPSPSPFPCFNFTLQGRVRLHLGKWWTDWFSLLASGSFPQGFSFRKLQISILQIIGIFSLIQISILQIISIFPYFYFANNYHISISQICKLLAYSISQITDFRFV